MNAHVRSEVGGSVEGKPARDVVLADFESLAGGKNQGIEERAPRNLLVV